MEEGVLSGLLFGGEVTGGALVFGGLLILILLQKRENGGSSFGCGFKRIGGGFLW